MKYEKVSDGMGYENSIYYGEQVMNYIDKEDNEIIKAINGDRDSFINIIERNKVDMYKLGRSILSCDDDIGDAMQEAVIKAFNNIGNLKNANSFKSWLLKIMVNECHNISNSKKKLVVSEEVNCDAIHNDKYEVDNAHVLELLKPWIINLERLLFYIIIMIYQ